MGRCKSVCDADEGGSVDTSERLGRGSSEACTGSSDITLLSESSCSVLPRVCLPSLSTATPTAVKDSRYVELRDSLSINREGCILKLCPGCDIEDAVESAVRCRTGSGTTVA